MHDIRESSFECQFDSVTHTRVARIRAWDAKEALQLFVAELRADGVEEPGEVMAAPVRGGAGSRARLRRRRHLRLQRRRRRAVPDRTGCRRSPRHEGQLTGCDES